MINETNQKLIDAIKNGDFDSAATAILDGADINFSNEYKVCPLHLAAQYDRSEIISFLCEKGANVNALTLDGWTPLHFAAARGYIESARSLLDHGTNPNIPGLQYKRTPLHYSADKGHDEVVAMIISAGGDKSLKDKHGKTALDLALANNHQNTADLLR